MYIFGKKLINSNKKIHNKKRNKLEQLEWLQSEDTPLPHHLMITHTIESYWISSEKKTKSKSQI